VVTWVKAAKRRVSSTPGPTCERRNEAAHPEERTMEITKGTLVLAFGANIDAQSHVRHPAKGDLLGIVKECDRYKSVVIVLDIISLAPQSVSEDSLLPLIQTDIDPERVPVEDLKVFLKSVLREQPEQIILNLGVGLGRKIIALERKLRDLDNEVRSRL
jgi:hypothetical protein